MIAEGMLYTIDGDHVMAFPEVQREVRRARFIGPSPVFRGKTAMIRTALHHPTIVLAQFDDKDLDFDGLHYWLGWHPFCIDAFEEVT